MGRKWLFCFVLGVIVASGHISSAQAQIATPARLTTPPSAQTLSDAFPVIPLARGVSGSVVLACRIETDGDSECAAAEETPEGLGFGAAAAAMAQDWRFQPRTQGGQPVPSIARVPVLFENPNAQAAMIDALGVHGVRGGVPPEASGEPTPVDMILCRWTENSGCLSLYSRPSAVDRDPYAEHYPARAQQGGIEGRALVACAVRSDRRVDCDVESETPDSWDFGLKAMDVVRNIAGRGRDRLQPGDHFRAVISFALHDPGRPIAPPDYYAEAPTGDDYARAYPRAAASRRIDGAVRLTCEIRADRRLNCSVADELPADMGFGAAALEVSAAFVLAETTMELPGFAVGDRITRMIRFQMR